MKRWRLSWVLVLAGVAGCDWGAGPVAGGKGKVPEVLMVHVGLGAEGATPDQLSEDAGYIAADLLRERKATRVTTISTFDKSDIYVQYGVATLENAQADVKGIIAQQSWLAGVDVSEVAAVSGAGMPRGVGVVRMQTIAIIIDRNVLASFPERGLEVEQVAAAVREIYPGGPATPEMVEQLKGLMLKTKDGGSVAFSSIATVDLRTVEDPIVRTYP